MENADLQRLGQYLEGKIEPMEPTRRNWELFKLARNLIEQLDEAQCYPELLPEEIHKSRVELELAEQGYRVIRT